VSKKWWVILLLALCLLILIFIVTYPDKEVKVVFCDVGQGDAILISEGKIQILIDGGPFSYSWKEYEGLRGLEREMREVVFRQKRSPVVDCLDRNMPFWDRKIEVVIATHPDLDHVGGLVSVLERFEVEKFLWNGEEGGSLAWSEVRRKVEEGGIYSKVLVEGDLIRFGKVELEVLSPDGKSGGWKDANEGSLVMMLRAREEKILLMGDATMEVERRLVWRKILDEEVDVLKAGHHGSKTSSSEELLDRVRPVTVVISAGKNNNYGHPAKEVLKRIEERGIEVRRTDEEGTILYRYR